MKIVLSSDDGFVPHLATALYSAWYYNNDADFFVLDCGIIPENVRALSADAEKKHIRLKIIKIDPEFIDQFPNLQSASSAVYARLILPSVLPREWDRVIYLDSDCVVAGSLLPLWSIDVSEHLLAAVRDIAAMREEKRKSGAQERGNYINTGVMLVNLAAWRQANFQGTAFEYARKATKFLHADQTIINTVAGNRVKVISDEWNLMPSIIATVPSVPNDPKIVHFAGAFKPWLHIDAPFAEEYFFHREQTPFAVKRPQIRYRSRLRVFANLMVFRKKYWRLALLARRCKNRRLGNRFAFGPPLG